MANNPPDFEKQQSTPCPSVLASSGKADCRTQSTA